MAIETPRRPDVATVRERLERPLAVASDAARRVRRSSGPVTRVVTPLGWGVLLLGIVCWVIGWRAGWGELMVIAAASWLLMVLSLLLTIGHAKLTVELSADPQRVTVGDPAAGAVKVRNAAKTLLLPIDLELPLGDGVARFGLPTLRPGADHEELFVVPTPKRGVVVVGPVQTVRGDPLGLLRRSVSWTERLEIFVHPVTVPLESLGAGLLRDLEGQITQDLSSSDLAFHALREYQPGDDRRFIHWRSSAKVGKFMVRQFQDTRRSHVCVIVDCQRSAYADPKDFELAISAAASVTVRAAKDENQISVFAGGSVAPSAVGSRVLDVFSRADFGTHRLSAIARVAHQVAPDVSTAFLVTGPHTTFTEMRRAASEFPIEVRAVVVQIDPAQRTGVRDAAGITLLQLQSLGELPSLLMVRGQ